MVEGVDGWKGGKGGWKRGGRHVTVMFLRSLQGVYTQCYYVCIHVYFYTLNLVEKLWTNQIHCFIEH